MTRIAVAFLCILWSGGINPGVVSAEETIENGVAEGFGIPPFRTKRENDETIVEGDIIVSKREASETFGDASMSGGREKRQAALGKLHGKWLGGVNYVFNASASKRLENCFRKAAAAWERDTCINFRQGKPGDYIFVTDLGCYSSYVGRKGGKQILSLRSYCEVELGNAIHEIGHALGLYHTSSRYDRNTYITVEPDIVEKYPNEFRIVTNEESENYETEYDYGSVMHHTQNVHYPIMFPADENYRRTMGSHIISFTDLWLINKHYGCLDKCKKEKRIECKNGGFPHPRRCETECICPGGYGGKRCDEPANNGERLNATANPQVLQAKVDKFDRKGSLGQYANRTYWIESPAHTVIEIEVAVESFFMDTNGCAKAAVEIKTNKNQTLTGYRFCSHGDRGIKLTSHSNLVPIIVYNRDPSIEFEVKITYHYVSENAQGQE